MTPKISTLKERFTDVRQAHLKHFQTYYEVARIFISML